MRYFFVESSALNKPTVTIKGSDARQIRAVLRLKPGDKIRLFDGEGFEYEAIINNLDTNRVEISITRRFPATKESPLQITVAQAFLKDKKMDTLLRHLCELGITKWTPFISQRSVPQPDAKRLSVRMARWEKIVKESFKQCRRANLPEISETLAFEEILVFGKDCDLKIIFWENESRPINSTIAPQPNQCPQNILIVLGPEGGFSTQEIKKAKDCGFVVAGLGPRILRAETATLAAVTLIQFLFGDMGPGSTL